MSISFKNEKDIENLKQSSYFMSIKNRKVMNEIMNSLIVEEQIQKISLETISSTFLSTFVV
jgi:hypothetical protein